MDLVFRDNIESASFTFRPGKKYKGHTKITLTNVDTGEVEVHEEDNYVTNAVSNIFSDNYSLTLDMAQLLPTYKLYHGVLCFQNNITGDETTVAPPNDDDNHLIAHAGDEAHVSASTLRGNPNGGETVIANNYVKLVWDWSTNQGNGTINCVCLTSSLCGNAGLKPLDDSYFAGLGSVCLAKIPFTTTGSYTRDVAIAHPLIYVDETTGKSLYYYNTQSAGMLEEITVKHDYLKFGLTRNVDSFVEASNRSATVRTITNFTAIFIDADYYYLVTPVSNTSLNIDKVSREDMTVTQMDIVNASANFKTDAGMGGLSKFVLMPSEPGYFYWPDVNNDSFYRISWANTTDIVHLTSNVSDVVHPELLINNWTNRTKCMNAVGEHLIVGPSYLINGTNVYPTKGISLSTGSTSDPYPPPMYLYGKGTNTRFQATLADINSRLNYSGACFNAIYLATINNLSQPVTKSNNQMMKIEYTLTEV